MKKIAKNFLVLIIMLFPTFVSAEEIYTTQNGCTLNKEQYNNLTEHNSEEDVNKLSCEMLDLVKNDENIRLSETAYAYYNANKVNSQIDNAYPLSSNTETHESASKILTVTAVTSTEGDNKYITINGVLTWKSMPKVRSFDVWGVYAPTSLGISPSTWSLSETANGKTTLLQSGIPLNMTFKSQGYGYMLAINETATKIPYGSSITTKAFVVGNPTSVRVSYQHAQHDVTFEEAMMYTFSTNGYGGVFDFTSAAGREYYDQMGGVIVPLAW